MSLMLEKHLGFTVARPATEWTEDVNAQFYIQISQGKADIFTFWNRLPDKPVLPGIRGKREFDNIAALPIVNVEYWRTSQVSRKVRNIIRKAVKSGIKIEQTVPGEEFYKALYSLYHGISFRQNKPFGHQHDSLEKIKSDFEKSRHSPFHILGAYDGKKLVGVLLLLSSKETLCFGLFTIADEYQKKGVPSLFMEKAVESAYNMKKQFLVYSHYRTDRETSFDSLRDFKRRCGFREMKVIRYYVPLTFKGKLALFLRLHKGKWALMPQFLKDIILSKSGLKLIRFIKRQYM
jgi:GNAT superfamily N-acetyltransferase